MHGCRDKMRVDNGENIRQIKEHKIKAGEEIRHHLIITFIPTMAVFGQ